MKFQLRSKRDTRFIGWGRVASARDQTHENMIMWDWRWYRWLVGIYWFWHTPFNRMQPRFWIELHLLGLRMYYKRETFKEFRIDPRDVIRMIVLLIVVSMGVAIIVRDGWAILHHHSAPTSIITEALHP